MKTDKERQSKRREEAAKKGLKSLSLGMVHESFHAPFKELARLAKEGRVGPGNVRAERVRDQAREDELKAKIASLERGKRDIEAAFVGNKRELERRDDKLAKMGAELDKARSERSRFKNVFWRLWWR